MKRNRNSIGFITQKYLIGFIVVVLALLWIFEVMLMDPFYKMIKQKEMETIAYNLKNEVYSNVDEIGLDINSYIVLVSSEGFITDHILMNTPESYQFLSQMEYRYIFSSIAVDEGYWVKSSDSNTQVISKERYAYFLKINDQQMLGVYASLIPTDTMKQTIQIQIGIISVLLLGISVFISYRMHKKLSMPIIKLSEDARKLKNNIDAASFSGVGYDEIEELSKTLNEMRTEISKVDGLKTELIGNVSHDLKTPLTMIGGYAEMMKDIPEERTQENLDIIISETHYLTELVNDLLNLSALQSGMQTLELSAISVNDLIEPIVLRFNKLFKDRSISYTPIDDTEINVDQVLMNQAIYNLINNAYVHTLGNVEIKVSVSESKVRVSVIDEGPGIDSDSLSTIWDRYSTTKLDHSRQSPISGLGLSIVKNIFASHKFEYGVISSVENGSEFWVDIKL